MSRNISYNNQLMNDIEEYNKNLEEQISKLKQKATEAKKNSTDLETEIGTEFADDMAGRCEKLLKIDGLADEIRKLEEQDIEREKIAFQIAKSFAKGDLGDIEDEDEKVEAAIRSSVALLTQGVVAAPIEGLGKVRTDEGFIRIPYNGPIRSAGGTGQALSVLIAEYVRQELNIDKYEPTKEEVERYIEELRLYHEEQPMQYLPSREEIKIIIENTPIMLDGDPTTDREVEGYRDLDRINTNRGRGGMCLVVAEGMALKAPKIKKFVEEFDIEGWDWISKLIEDEDEDEEDEEGNKKENKLQRRRTPKQNWEKEFPDHDKYIKDITAGRPILSEPGKGLRLRYGRSRNIGLAAAGLNPATMEILDQFIANSTQLKTERPGKALGVAGVTSIEGPTIKHKQGHIQQINKPELAKKLVEEDQIERVIDLGEILICYGEFLENNHKLPPSPYTKEWWEQDIKHSNTQKTPEQLEKLNVQEYLQTAKKENLPLHPKYTPHWTNITTEELKTLKQNITHKNKKSTLPNKHREIIEKLLIPAIQKENKIIIKNPHHTILKQSIPQKITQKPILQQITNQLGIETLQRETIRIGARMGRPEQAKVREMNPAVHGLYPISEAGGDTRNIIKASKNTENLNKKIQNKKTNQPDQEQETKQQGQVQVNINHRQCPNCQTKTHNTQCPQCKKRTKQAYKCTNCKNTTPTKPQNNKCPQCNTKNLQTATKQTINTHKDLNQALKNINEQNKNHTTIKGVKKLFSKNKPPEPLEKAILRKNNKISTFRDGTTRYDIMDLPLTAFKPKEINLTPQQVKDLGYKQDIHGNPITSKNQVIELYPQDVIVSKRSATHLLNTANYIDDLLQKYYNKQPHYNANNKQDLIGSMILGLAPHTSAAVTGRLIGFTNSAANYASPFWHAAKRRNCYHPKTSINTKQNNKWKNHKIKNFVEKHLQENPQQDEHGTKYTNIKHKNIKTESYNPENQQTTTKQITHVNKHPAPKHLIKIQTQAGQTLKITPEHPVLTYNPQTQKHQEKQASEVEQEDHIITKKHKHHIQEPKEIDVLEELLRNPNVDNHNITIKNIDELKQIFKDYYNTQSYLKKLSEETEINKKTLYNYFDYNSIPADILLEAFKNDTEMLQKLPKNIKIGRRKQREEINRIIKLDHDLATLLGYYTAEGWYREQQLNNGTNKGVNQVTIAATEQESRNFLLRIFKRMGMNPYEENENKITVSGYNTKELFKTTLDTGYGAENKFIPQIIKNSNNKKVKAAYLSGYFSGDGSASSSNGVVSCSTVSERLRDELREILNNEFDIETTYRTRESELVRERFPDEVPEYYEKKTKESYRIQISDNESFYKEISFYLKRKELTGIESYKKLKGVDSSDVRKNYLCIPDKVKSVEHVETTNNHVYSVTVEDLNNLVINSNICGKNCDGDQDSIMLLMDGLLNFSEEYLPDIRGQRSVGKDQRVFVNINGDHRAVRISDLVDGYVEDYGCEERFDGFEVARDVDENVEVLSFDSETYEVNYSPVSAFIRHENDKDVYKISTLKGDVTVTEDHSVFTTNGENIEEATVSELEKGDTIIVPDNIDLDNNGGIRDEVNVAELLYDNGYDVYVELSDMSLEEFNDTFSYEGDRYSDNSIYRYKNGNRRVPYELVRDYSDVNLSGDDRVQIRSSNRSVKAIFRECEEFYRLIGHLLAEGHLEGGELCNTDEEVCTDMMKCCREVFDSVSVGVDSREGRKDCKRIRIPRTAMVTLFELGLDNRKAKQKRIPSFVFTAKDEYKDSLLKAFLDGGGTEYKDENRYRLYTYSEEMASQFSILARSLGYKTGTSYQDLGDRKSYEVSIGEWNELDSYWPAWDLMGELRSTLKESGYSYEEIESIVSNYRKNDRMKTVSKSKVEEFASLGVSSLENVVEGDLCVERITCIEAVDYGDDFVYDLEVPGRENFLCGPHPMFCHNTMDAPLVVTGVVDPSEVDDEAYNVDVEWEYGLEFFELTQCCPGPKEVDMDIAESFKDVGYGFGHSVGTELFDVGPSRSKYATLEGMDNKVYEQMRLADLVDSVGVGKVAELVLSNHFFSDVMGNLSSFSTQEFQCVRCYEKYRRVPLDGLCDECGYDLNLTLYEGSVDKYVDIIDYVIDEYDVSDYTEQKFMFIKSRLEGMFDSDAYDQSGIDDFL